MLALFAMAGEVRAQNLGDPCPLSQVGKVCSGAGTCLKFTCSVQSANGAAKTEALGFCDGTPNLCPPGSQYMGPCGNAGKCMAGQTGFGGADPEGGTINCTAGIYTCFDPPPGAYPPRFDAGSRSLGVDGGVATKGQEAHGSGSDAGPSNDVATKSTSTNNSGGCSISLGRTPTRSITFVAASVLAGLMLRLRVRGRGAR